MSAQAKGAIEPHRHFWLPASDDIRHAFRGRRWDHCEQATSICGSEVGLSEPSQDDWIRSPTCMECNRVLRSELPVVL